MYCDLWPYVLWPLDFQIQKRIVSAETIWGNTVIFSYCISTNSFLPSIVSPFNSFRGNYSIHEVKNCHNAETIWNFPHFPLSKKTSFCGNYTRKYGIWWNVIIQIETLWLGCFLAWSNVKPSFNSKLFFLRWVALTQWRHLFSSFPPWPYLP